MHVCEQIDVNKGMVYRKTFTNCSLRYMAAPISKLAFFLMSKTPNCYYYYIS